MRQRSCWITRLKTPPERSRSACPELVEWVKMREENENCFIPQGKEDMKSQSSPKMIYEPEDDVLNLWLSRKPIDYAEQIGDVIVHFTKDQEAVYIEILDASKLFKRFKQNSPQKS